MKESLRIRPAFVGDTVLIQALLQELGYAMAPEQISEKIVTFARKQGHHAFVAEIDGNMVGFASLHVMEWFHKPECVARLSAIVVKKESRGCGIGRALMQFAEEKAVEAGCTMMEVSSGLHRRAEGTYKFYASLGYLDAKEQSTYFRKNLA